METIKIDGLSVLKLKQGTEITKCIVLDCNTLCNTATEVVVDHLCYDGNNLFILQGQSHRLPFDNKPYVTFKIVRYYSNNANLADVDYKLNNTKDEDMVEIDLIELS